MEGLYIRGLCDEHLQVGTLVGAAMTPIQRIDALAKPGSIRHVDGRRKLGDPGEEQGVELAFQNEFPGLVVVKSKAQVRGLGRLPEAGFWSHFVIIVSVKEDPAFGSLSWVEEEETADGWDGKDGVVPSLADAREQKHVFER